MLLDTSGTDGGDVGASRTFGLNVACGIFTGLPASLKSTAGQSDCPIVDNVGADKASTGSGTLNCGAMLEVLVVVDLLTGLLGAAGLLTDKKDMACGGKFVPPAHATKRMWGIEVALIGRRRSHDHGCYCKGTLQGHINMQN